MVHTPGFQVEFVAAHAGDFAEALAGDQAKLQDLLPVARNRRFGKPVPDGADFVMGQHAIAPSRVERLFHAEARVLFDQAFFAPPN